LAEASALDRVLDAAPKPSSRDVEALAARIVAKAAADIVPGRSRPNVVPLGRTGSWRARGGWSGAGSSGWQAAALLAASLFVGAFVGTAGLLNSAVAPLAEVVASQIEGEPDSTQLALGSDSTGFLSEDLL
jgi:hypothetical protein